MTTIFHRKNWECEYCLENVPIFQTWKQTTEEESSSDKYDFLFKDRLALVSVGKEQIPSRGD